MDQKSNTPYIRENNNKLIQSKAVDINGMPIRTIINLLKKLNPQEKFKILKAFGWMKFSSRTVCFKKKNKIPDSLRNLRAIQISPWSFKVAEQSRIKLRQWLDANTDKRCFAFKKGGKVEDLINWIKSMIKSDDPKN